MKTDNNIYFSVSEIKYTEDEDSRPHLHDYYSIYWIREGEAIHANSFVEYTVRVGSMFFVPPDFEHKMIVPHGCRGTAILFNKSFTLLQNKEEDPIFSSPLFNNPDFYTIVTIDQANAPRFDDLIRLLAGEHIGAQKYSCTMIQHLLLLFLYQAKRLHDEQYSPDKLDTENKQHTVIEFKKLINNHYMQSKDVSFYAELLNMRPTCLNEISKRFTGITAGELIRNRVLDETKKLLFSTDINTKEIAYRLGFDDPAYFSRFFKKYTGVTLIEFRELSRKKYHTNGV